MKLTLFSFAIYLCFCVLGFCGGAILGFTSSAFILFSLDIISDSLIVPYIIGAIIGLFGAALGLIPAFMVNFVYDFCMAFIDEITGASQN